MEQKDRTYSIYRHTSPSGKVYIGQTCSKVWVRWLHNGNGYKTKPYFWRAIQRYGWDNFTHEVLLEGISKKESKKGHKYGPQSALHSLHKAEAHKVPIIQVDINNPCIWKEWKSAKDVQDALGF